MRGEAPALIASAPLQLANADPVITFPTTGGGNWEVWDRFLAISGASVVEIGNICETCQFWFRRLPAEAAPVDQEAVQQILTAGLDMLNEEVVGAFGKLLQSGTYRVAFFRLVPKPVEPGSADDYFCAEQPREWPHIGEIDDQIDPATSYYRVRDRSDVQADEGGRGFEFIVPLQSPESLDEARISFFQKRFEQGDTPTAVAVGVLDIKQYWDTVTAHWCLSHYLLDGHHKVEAAARLAQPLTLLSFIACDRGISGVGHVDRLLENYGLEPEVERT